MPYSLESGTHRLGVEQIHERGVYAGPGKVDTRNPIPDARCQIQDTRYPIPETINPKLGIGLRVSGIGFQGSERRGKTWKGFKDFGLKAKTRICLVCA
jgi:hypothetical protein